MKKEPPPHQARLRSRQQSRLQRNPSGGGGSSSGIGRAVAFACTAGALLAACVAPSAKAAAAAAAAPPLAFAVLPLLSLASGAASASAASASIAGGEVDPDGEVSGGVRGGEVVHAPRVPFCRAGADVANMWLPVWNPDNAMVQTAKRVVVFGGKGVDYQDKRQGEPLTYLADMWALHITNTGFSWNKITPHGEIGPSPRWQTGHAVAYGSSLVVYGGDDQSTNLVGGLGDLWVYSPRGTKSYLHADGEDYSNPNARDEWKAYAREGSLPGARREPSLTMVNSTLLLQGGKVDVGESDEECDSRFFLVDLSDPKGVWREGPSFPGECGVGQTMNTVNVTRTDDSGEEVEVPLAVVFGGCKWDSRGVFACSNDLYAYDPEADTWSEIVPESDADAFACVADDTEEEGAEVAHAATAPEDGAQQSLSSPSTASMSSSGELGNSSSSASSSSSSTTTTTTTTSGAGAEGKSGEKNITKKKKKKKKAVVCPGVSTARPLGRHAHASAYIASKEDNVNALFVFGGRENADELAPLGDLWMFDFKTMRWSEITPGSKKAPSNRFDHSLTVWQGGAGDGVASLVVFGGQSITRSGQTVFMNDVWLYTPHTGLWREVSQSDCRAGASGIVKGGGWTAVTALVSLLLFVLVVQCFLHRICPEYEPPLRRRRRRRRKSDRPLSMSSGSLFLNGGDSGAGGGGGGGRERPKSTSALVTQALLTSSSSSSSSGKPKPSYQAIAE